MTEVSQATRFHAVSWWGSVLGLGILLGALGYHFLEMRKFDDIQAQLNTIQQQLAPGSSSPRSKASTWQFDERAARAFRSPDERPLAWSETNCKFMTSSAFRSLNSALLRRTLLCKLCIAAWFKLTLFVNDRGAQIVSLFQHGCAALRFCEHVLT